MELKNLFVQDIHGNVIPLPAVTVYLAGTTTLAEGLADENLAPLSNPFVGSAFGLVSFYAPDGLYDMLVEGADREFTLRLQFVTPSPPVQFPQPLKLDAPLAGTWILGNPLGRIPTVQVFLDSGEQIIADVTADASTITVSFAVPHQGYVLAF